MRAAQLARDLYPVESQYSMVDTYSHALRATGMLRDLRRLQAWWVVQTIWVVKQWWRLIF
jgi:hypothetical protein